MIRLEGTAALITGSSRGIGRAAARKLAEAGADLCITYLNSPRDARELAHGSRDLRVAQGCLSSAIGGTLGRLSARRDGRRPALPFSQRQS